MSVITRAYHASKLALKSNSPTIMVTAGIVSMGAAAILASKQTLKVEEVLEKHVPDLQKIDQGEALGLESYDKDTARSDRFKVYSRAGFELTKLYAVPGLLFVGGAGLVFGGHRIMVKRNATLAIAFSALKRSFDEYRGRVVENYGTEVDANLMSGYRYAEVLGEDGEATGHVKIRDVEDGYVDPYNRVFGEGYTPNWHDNLGVNRTFVLRQQKIANDLLKVRGHIYLSDVYESLGFPETDISRVVGWKITTSPTGEKHFPTIDFGVDKINPDDDQYNATNSIYLDFNCQGLIVGGKVQKALENA